MNLGPAATYVAISDRERHWNREHVGKGSALRRIGGVSAGACVVDVGAGQGWLAIQLGRQHHVTAVEPNAQLRQEASRRARHSPKIQITGGTAACVPVSSRTADLVVSVGSSFGYGSAEEDAAAFDEMRRVLKPGACAVVEAMSAEGASRSQARTTSFPDGSHATYTPSFDASQQVLHDRQSFHHRTSHGSFAYAMRTYDPGDLLTFARWSGLRVAGVFGGFDDRRWRPPNPIVLVVRAPLAAARSVR